MSTTPCARLPWLGRALTPLPRCAAAFEPGKKNMPPEKGPRKRKNEMPPDDEWEKLFEVLATIPLRFCCVQPCRLLR